MDREDIERLVRIDEGVKNLCGDVKEIKATNEKQWERISHNSENIKEVRGELKAHMEAPHCGEEDKGLDEVEKEAKEISRALVFLIRFCRSKAGKGTGLLALILGIIGAAKQLGLF